MKCPYCGSPATRVVDSRPAQKSNAIRRRRECEDCGKRFTTYEYVVEYPLMVIKNDGRREEYSRDKLLKSIKIACNKRPISPDKIESIVMDIEKEIEEKAVSEIPSSLIGELVMKYLRNLDEVAYIRFASVYKKFRDLDEFRDQIEKLSSG
ncbi:MAG: transcriptional regulator NrdR [Candidatus Neomarinimicrobiota bacterium]|nr:transcriptional repressor NrdR [Candidatus Neomarinimicrobiota bacterium]MCD6101306.1 transcriptional repressor NrdR [Candidatus Neomarinimicrobiota bacterium]RKY50565.1 MAG: transcriptional regulator NrdR [Candidatus Neomarinimicrobiota bacterium]HDN58717.1 transcriptional repressor NrdR [Candidatus Neomarinimicrobiota bacterium]